MSNNNLCTNLRRLREAKGYTQKEIAEQLNTLSQTYSNYETGQRIPSLDFLIDLSEFYHIPLDILICGVVDGNGNTARTPLNSDLASLLTEYQALSSWDQHEIRSLIRLKLQKPSHL